MHSNQAQHSSPHLSINIKKNPFWVHKIKQNPIITSTYNNPFHQNTNPVLKEAETQLSFTTKIQTFKQNTKSKPNPLT